MRTAQVYTAYVDAVGQGDITRREAALMFGVSKSTAAYHLERAVAEGELERFYTFATSNQTGYAYRRVGTQQMMDGFEDLAREGDYQDTPHF